MMKYFGTDGIRRQAEFFMNGEFTAKFARGLNAIFGCKSIAIARDSRVSGRAIEDIITRELLNIGVDVHLLGIVPTPALMYYVSDTACDIGIMITASHNPPSYNGLKIISPCGEKLDETAEMLIECYIDSVEDSNISRVNSGSTRDNGQSSRCSHQLGIDGAAITYVNGTDYYMQKISEVYLGCGLEGIRLIIDCAYGATANVARRIFSGYHAICEMRCDDYFGELINLNCGALYAENLDDSDCDLAIAFDGDGDRIICKRNGIVLDGDSIIYMLAVDAGVKSVAVTVISNMGLITAFEKIGISVIIMPVGDKYIQQAVTSGLADMGAESSGHVILSSKYCGGDGILVGLAVARFIHAHKEYCDISKYPSELINFNLDSMAVSETDFCAVQPEIVAKGGRLLIRRSGTENKLRILIEMPTVEYLNIYIEKINKIAINISNCR